MAADKTFIFPKELYATTLNQIEGVQFTQREVDIMACLISARRPSAIASLLAISPNTVATHLRNIMLKIGCNSQNSIISFLERSAQYNDLRNYYYSLCLLTEFRRTLKEISRKTLKIKPKAIQIQVECEQLHARLQTYLPEHLRIMNARLRVTETPEVFLIHLHHGRDDIPTSSLFSIRSDMSYPEALIHILSLLYPSMDFENQIQQLMDKVNEFCGEAPHVESNGRNLEDSASKHPENKPMKPRLVKNYKPVVGGAFAVILGLMVIVSNPYFSFMNFLSIRFAASETWNLPHTLPHHIERESLIDEIYSKFAEQQDNEDITIVGVHGLGGVGKTTLANYVVNHPHANYSFIGWFHAETPELLEAEYNNLGLKHDLFSKSAPDHLKIHMVKEWLNQQDKVLVVYDNVPDMEMVELFLPHNGDIIITSRNYKLPNAIKIMTMTETEALTLMGKLIPLRVQNQDDYNEQIRVLVKRLGYLPLALSQAGYYIHENDLTVSEYLNLYDANKEKLLSEDSMPPADQHAPAYITWDMSLQKIQGVPGGKEALKLLRLISYCYPEKIPVEILMQALYGDVTDELRFKLNKHIKLLNQYSLIDVSHGSVSIHRLVHSWAKKNDTKEEILWAVRAIANAIEVIYPGIEERKKSTADIKFARKMLPHAEYILSEWGDMLESTKVLSMLIFMADAYELLGYFKISKDKFKEALESSKSKFGKSHPNTATMLFHIAWNNRVLGKLKKSNRLSQEALEILNKTGGSSSLFAAEVLSNYGLTELLLCHYKNAKEILTKSKHIIEDSHAENHVNVSFPTRRLGLAYLYLGEYSKAEQYLTKALSGIEAFFGENHYRYINVTNNLGVLYTLTGRLKKAEKLLVRAMKFKEGFYRSAHKSTAKAYYRLANVYLYLGEYEQAEIYYQKAVDTVAQLSSNKENDIYYNIYISSLGNIKRLLGQGDEGIDLLQESLTNMHTYYKEHNVNTACIMANMSLAYGANGDDEKKSEYLQKALTIFKENLPSTHPYVKQAKDAIGRMNDTDESPPIGFAIHIEA